MQKHTLRKKEIKLLQSLLDFADLPAEKLATQGAKIESLLRLASSGNGPGGLPWRPDRRDGAVFVVVGDPASEQRLQQLQRRLLMFLHALSATSLRNAPRSRQLQRAIKGFPRLRMMIEAVAGGSRFPFWVIANPHERVLWKACELVKQIGQQRLRTCGADGCSKLLINTGNKEFCSSRCSQRMYMRAYRDNNFNPPPLRGSRKKAAHGKTTGKRRRQREPT